MLPKFLYGSYKRYKTDTSTFVDWIINAAKKCGCEATLQPQRATEASSKASRYKVTLQELRRLAQAIADTNTKVPSIVLATVTRAIALRKRCANWFSTGRTGAVAANEKHSHFIDVLEELVELLGWHSVQHSHNASAPDKAETPNPLANRFAGLTVEEIEEADEADETAIEMPVPSDRGLVEIDEEDGPGEDEYSQMMFHIFCLFEDLRRVRQFSSETLSEYVDGKIDLNNMAVVIDTAVHLSKQLIDEVTSTWAHIPVLQRGPGFQQLMYVTACTVRGENMEARPDPSVPYNINLEDVADWCYLPTHILLQSFIPVLQPGELPVFKKGYFGTYNASARRDRMSPGERFNEDKILLLQLLPEFALLQQFNIETPVEDEITAGMMEYTKTKKLPMWLSFAAQLLLDVHHGLRHTKGKAFNDLRMTALRTKKTIEDYWELSKSFTGKPKFWPKEGDQNIKRIHNTAQAWVVEDLLYEFKNASLPPSTRKTYEAAGGVDRHLLLQSHGVLCGLISFKLTLWMQYIGLALINQWYDVAQMAYLYNMIQQSGVPNFKWPDMDVFIDLHGEEHIFIGGRPKTADEAIKKLRMATGTAKASDFAPNSRGAQGRSIANMQSSARTMEPGLAVKNIFQARYMEHGRSRISVDNVDQLIKEITSSLEGNKTSKQLQRSTASSGLQLMKRQWGRSHCLGALQLLASIRQGLYTEEPRLQFNYFGMHKRCIEILRKIQAKEDHKFRQYFGPKYMPDDTFISNLVILVLTVAQGGGAAGQGLGLASMLSQGGGSIVSRMVMSCSEVMKEYLRDKGDSACKEIKAFCKNKSLADPRETTALEGYAHWFSVEEVIGPASIASLQTGIPVAL
ncbi:hypothetical protein F4780DRAFT_739756 [Xylariomycetidae sp. FL0641]|nr:hypothetical protein F4780DRAFT_739756 [Xylariomycetidae sp. FL0641]